MLLLERCMVAIRTGSFGSNVFTTIAYGFELYSRRFVPNSLLPHSFANTLDFQSNYYFWFSFFYDRAFKSFLVKRTAKLEQQTLDFEQVRCF